LGGGATGISLLDRVACTTPPGTRPQKLLRMVAGTGCRVVELRLDLLNYSRDEARRVAEELASRGVRVIATLRDRREGGAYSGPDEDKLQALLGLVDHGAWLIDLEYRFNLLDEALRQTRKVIVSFHDYRWTPPPEILYSYAGDMLRRGAAIAKIVTTAHRLSDNWKILGLNAWRPGRVTAFAMGERGRLSRILAPLLGAPLTYAALGEPVAPGQLGLRELLEAWRLLGAPLEEE